MKRKGSARLDYYLGSSQGWKSNFRRECNSQKKIIKIPKVVEPSYVKKQVTIIKEKRRYDIQ